MSKKFTEEQYQKLCGIDLSNWKINNDKAVQFHNSEEGYIALAIANPLTREWAHDNFVEKEKRYYWTSKKSDKENEHYRLYRRIKGGKGSGIVPYFNNIGDFDDDYAEQLTESEIKEWGYNPEMFDKEEV